jgi:hypothetical protein
MIADGSLVVDRCSFPLQRRSKPWCARKSLAPGSFDRSFLFATVYGVSGVADCLEKRGAFRIDLLKDIDGAPVVEREEKP